ncbi:transposase [Alternaria alternata]|nr:transposase [Alternaria alternata]
MVIVVGTGGGAAAVAGAVAPKAAAVTAALVSEGALAVGSAAGSVAVAEGALTTAIVAESAVTALTGLTATQFWNPVGWVVGGVLVGASQQASQAVTWGCYKPIIGEVDTKETLIKPTTLANLAAHPEVRQVFVYASAASANLPNVEVRNKAGECYLLRGVVLPWGSANYASKVLHH